MCVSPWTNACVLIQLTVCSYVFACMPSCRWLRFGYMSCTRWLLIWVPSRTCRVKSVPWRSNSWIRCGRGCRPRVSNLHRRCSGSQWNNIYVMTKTILTTVGGYNTAKHLPRHAARVQLALIPCVCLYIGTDPMHTDCRLHLLPSGLRIQTVCLPQHSFV